ncbi:ATP-grasp fold amidoligase family protein [Vibrio breoganii]
MGWIKSRLLPERLFIKSLFKTRAGYTLNLNDPKSFNEKIQWLKLNDRTELHTICADKLAVREFVTEEIGPEFLVPLIKYTDNVDDITLDWLPSNPCIIKATHTSGTYKIIRDKKRINIFEVDRLCRKWLKKNYYYNTKEWQYKNIPPRIIVEELLVDENGLIPSDLKFSCFNGRVEMIHVDSNKEDKHLRNHYSREWKPLDFRWPEELEAGQLVDKPRKLDKMIELAEKLAQNFVYVRVDFYCLEDQIYFGELTFHPTSGFGRFLPFEEDRYYGDKLNITHLM